ncbi:MAG: hypothetical protein V3V26_01025 [Candidatus Aenigmarchaeota archaeon]
MDAQELLIVDIDGVISTYRDRKRLAYKSVSGKDVSDDRIDTLDIRGELGEDGLERFEDVFFSRKYLHTDVPRPGAAHVLQKALRRNSIVYFTSRQDGEGDSMKVATVDWLDENGFPILDKEGVYLFMRPSRHISEREYKDRTIGQILALGIPIAGIGDKPHDSEVYGDFKVQPIIFRHPRHGEGDYAQGTVFVNEWSEIKNWLRGNGNI